MGLAVVGLVSATSAQTVIFTDGNPGDWSGDGGATTVPTGTGGVNAPNGGSSFTQLNNLDDGYGYAGYGDGPYSLFGPGITTSGSFYQSVSVYINTSWAQAAVASTPSFWIDMSPAHPAGNYGAEHNFQVTANGSSVSVSVDGQATPIATIASSGWYTFQMLYRSAANPADPLITDMNIYDLANNLIGTTTVDATSPGGPLASQDVTGSDYVWFTVWQNGFANDTLDVANVEASVVPEPTTMTLLLLAFGVGTLRILRKRQMA